MGSCPMSGYPSDDAEDLEGIGDLKEIVWLESPSKFTYLREAEYHSCSSRFPSKSLLKKGSRLIGYQLVSHLSARVFNFRFWYLREYDRDLDPEGVYKDRLKYPCEAVLPSSIARDMESVPYRGVF